MAWPMSLTSRADSSANSNPIRFRSTSAAGRPAGSPGRSPCPLSGYAASRPSTTILRFLANSVNCLSTEPGSPELIAFSRSAAERASSCAPRVPATDFMVCTMRTATPTSSPASAALISPAASRRSSLNLFRRSRYSFLLSLHIFRPAPTKIPGRVCGRVCKPSPPTARDHCCSCPAAARFPGMIHLTSAAKSSSGSMGFET